VHLDALQRHGTRVAIALQQVGDRRLAAPIARAWRPARSAPVRDHLRLARLGHRFAEQPKLLLVVVELLLDRIDSVPQPCQSAGLAHAAPPT